jgi:D-aspartate ligase
MFSLMKADNTEPVVLLNAATHGGLGILRSLGRLGIPVYAMHPLQQGPATFSRYCRGKFELDFYSASDADTTECLVKVARLLGRRSVLVPSCDYTAMYIARQAACLSPFFRFPIVSAELVRSLTSKKHMHFLARRCGVPTPEADFPHCRQEAAEFARQCTFPVVLKGIDGTRLSRRTGKTMSIARSASELLELYDQLEDSASSNLMLQEYIPGGDDSVWMFNGYFDGNSNCLAGFTGRKIRQSPVSAGITTLGICERNRIVEETTKQFMKRIGYKGILDIGYRYDARDRRYKVLDVNPRIGCTFRLFVDDNGLDVVRACYLDLTGQSVPSSSLREGRKWLVELPDLVSCVEYHRQGNLTLRQWFVSLQGIEETGYFAWDDLRPFWRMCTQGIVQHLRWDGQLTDSRRSRKLAGKH